jgi:hypothetical protein
LLTNSPVSPVDPEARKRDLIRLDFRVKPQQGKPRRLPLVVLRPAPNGASIKPEDRVYILIDIQPEKTRLDDPKSGSEALAELLRDTSNAEFAVWTNGTERIVWWKEAGRIKIRTKLISDIPRFGKGAEDCFTLDKQALRPAGGLSPSALARNNPGLLAKNDPLLAPKGKG